MDRISPEKRSWIMAQVKDRDTGPERAVRSLLHRLGCRFRLHRADLPGTPDIVLPKRRTVIFVHGCFWHRHAGCRRATMPASNTEYWKRKFSRIVARDAQNTLRLEQDGWRVMVVWECELKDIDALAARFVRHFIARRPNEAAQV